MKKILITLLTAGSLVLSAVPAFGTAVNITIGDSNPGLNSFNGGPFGAGLEDNETEPTTISDQSWDMEAFVVDGSKLHIISGYNTKDGHPTFNYKPGDLFIKVGGSSPGFGPTASGTGDVSNSDFDDGGYTHVIDLTQGGGLLTTSPATAYSLDSDSVFNSVTFDSLGSNPWRYKSDAAGTAGSSAWSFATYGTDAAVNALFGGSLLSLKSEPGNTTHYVLTVDLGFLGAVSAGTAVYFSYTMECGNDSIKGRYEGGFDRVPDSAASLLLIGVGFGTLALLGLRRRKA